MPLMVQAKEKNGFSYEYYGKGNKKVMITDILQAGKILEIPEMMDGRFVTKIELEPSEYVSVEKLILPKSLKEIKKCADDDYYYRRQIMYGQKSFLECFPNLKEVVIPPESNDLCTDGKAIYSKDRSILYDIMPAVTEYELPATVTKIQEGALHGLNQLHTITVEPGNAAYTAENGVLYTKDKTTLLLMPVRTRMQVFTVPEGVTRIGKTAFEKQKVLESVEIPGTVDVIGEGAFACCAHLKRVHTRRGVRVIGDFAFYGSWELEQVVMEEGIQKIGEAAFEGTVIKNLDLPSTVESIRTRRISEPELPLEQLDTLTIRSKYMKVSNFYYIGELAEYPVVYAVKNSPAYQLFQKVVKVRKLTGAGTAQKEVKRSKKEIKALREKAYKWFDRKEKVHEISKPEHLIYLEIVAGRYYLDKYTFVQTKDIDLKHCKEFVPIAYFDGTYDGKGHKIKNLTLNRAYADGVGLFSDVRGGTVKNLNVEGSVNGRTKCGLLCGQLRRGTITNCSVKGEVKGMSGVGGAVGEIWTKGKISNIRSATKVSANYFAGGIVGYDNDGKKKNMTGRLVSDGDNVTTVFRYQGAVCSNADQR